MGFTFSQSECARLDRALGQEWLETNGIGGYASSTIPGLATRKYHSLLAVRVPGLDGPYSLLGDVEESISIDDRIHLLSSNQYPFVIQPQGYEYITQFNLDSFPQTIFRIENLTLIKSILMVQGENTVLLRYELRRNPEPATENDSRVTLRLNPLVAYRSVHSLAKENSTLNVRTTRQGQDWKLTPYNHIPPLFMQPSARDMPFYPGPDWYNNREYKEESDRGYDFREDLFCPGVFAGEMPASIIFRFALTKTNEDLETIWKRQIHQRQASREQIVAKAKNWQPANKILTLHEQARHFTVQDGDGGRRILAGYPWLESSPRDTMIALPGLLFSGQRYKEGLEILENFCTNALSQLYTEATSLDAYLWFFWTVQEFFRHTNDHETLKVKLLPTMQEIIHAFLTDKVPLTRLTRNGLLWSGEETSPTTWMGASAWNTPVTPRHGMAIEINALWYNALRFCGEFPGERLPGLGEITQRCGESISREFWNGETGYLFDVVGEQGGDDTLRPNQIFAISLPYSALNEEQAKSVIKAVDKDLVTAYGLRTLSPRDPRFCPLYFGHQDERDTAYHQGTVWPWLIGHYVQGYLRVHKDQEAAKKYLREKFKPLIEEHLTDHGLGGVSEIFDGDPPHKARGCYTQAWSVAEIIRTQELLC